MSDELETYASASPRRRRIIRAGNSAKAAQSAGFRRIGYNPNPLSHMPKGGSLSPGCGEPDLGLLSQREALKAFPALKKMKSGVVGSSRRLPAKKAPY